jgi:hypothetical protein
VLGGDDKALPPRAAALARLAVTLTAEPWALTRAAIDDVAEQGLDADQIEAAVGVIAMFNYFTRVADATGIDFDYATPLPKFEPDLCRVPAPRPRGVATPSRLDRTLPRLPGLRAAWETWQSYVLDSSQPLSRDDRLVVAATAVDEATGSAGTAPGPLVDFARKLSRQPWTMLPADLDALRSHGYSDLAILHLIAVVAHENATTRLRIGLTTAGLQPT